MDKCTECLGHTSLHDCTLYNNCEVLLTSREIPLQPLSGEILTYVTANVEDGARLDISAAGFWGSQAFLMLTGC